MSEILKLLFLYFLNLVGDYPLQGEFLANMKGKYNYLLFVHCAIWTGTVCVGLYLIGSLSAWKIIFLLAGHIAIDFWKARKKDKTNALTRDLWIDQFLHFLQILIVWRYE